MSEKIQRTAATTRETMKQRYNDGLHHKHNKCHLLYRAHWPSHPAYEVQRINGHDQTNETFQSTGLVRKENLEKIRKKRFDNRIYH